MLRALLVVDVLNCRLVNLCCAFGPDGVLRGHKDVYGSGGISLHPVAAARVTSTEVCSRGYKRAREG
jgi:hypothetical protein